MSFRHRIGRAGVALVAVVASTAGAQEITGEARALVGLLSSDEYAERERATTLLLELEPWPDDGLWALLGDRGLPAEAHARLMWVMFDRWSSMPRAAMGVSFPTRAQQGANAGLDDGVRLETTIEGFNAHEVLRANDVIVEASGVSLAGLGGSDRARLLLGALIVMHSPGDVMTLRVRRDGEEFETEVRLGSLAQLDGVNRNDPGRMGAAYFVYTGTEGRWPYADDGAIGSGLDAEALARAALDGESAPDETRTRVETRARSGAVRRGVSIGGAPGEAEPLASADRTESVRATGLWATAPGQLWAQLGEHAALARRLAGETDPDRRARIIAQMDEIALEIRPGRARLTGTD